MEILKYLESETVTYTTHKQPVSHLNTVDSCKEYVTEMSQEIRYICDIAVFPLFKFFYIYSHLMVCWAETCSSVVMLCCYTAIAVVLDGGFY